MKASIEKAIQQRKCFNCGYIIPAKEPCLHISLNIFEKKNWSFNGRSMCHLCTSNFNDMITIIRKVGAK